MLASSIVPLSIELVAQHARVHERVLQVQFINAAHERQIRAADRLGQIIHAAPADAGQLGLTADRKCVVAVYHRFALNNATEVRALSKKSFASSQLPNLGMQYIQINGWLCPNASSVKHRRPVRSIAVSTR